MSDNAHPWTAAELVARCQAGDAEVWDRLFEMIALAGQVVFLQYRHRHGAHTEEAIKDAVQTVLLRWWQERTTMLEAFRPDRGSLWR